MCHGMIEDNLTFVDGIEVRIHRKRVKNLRIRVVAPDGHVEASTPLCMSRAQVEAFVRSRAEWIARQQQRLQTSPQRIAELASKEECAVWRDLIAALVPPLVEKWEEVLGVHAGSLAYRNMRSRWGSCQPETGRICINTRLALYPPECLEYVVVHELAHLLEANHGPAFYAILDRALPTWKSARDKLRA